MENILPTFIENGLTPDIVDQSVDGTTYLGFCQPGTSVMPGGGAQAVWLIKKIIDAGGITTTYYADGQKTHDKIWDNRAAYTYTFAK